jgi:hypothetical protein
MDAVYANPSFYAHIMNGILLVLALILVYKNYSKITHLEPYKLVIVTLLFSAVIGIHGLSHLGLEKGYGYNPLSIII